MSEFSEEVLIDTLNEILEAELSGVVRYTHYSLMIAGPHRIPLVDFMKAQAVESLDHAQQVGEILTGFGGHPSTKIATVEETYCLLYTSPSPRDRQKSRMPSSA